MVEEAQREMRLMIYLSCNPLFCKRKDSLKLETLGELFQTRHGLEITCLLRGDETQWITKPSWFCTG